MSVSVNLALLAQTRLSGRDCVSGCGLRCSCDVFERNTSWKLSFSLVLGRYYPSNVRAGRLGELVKRESWQLEEMKIPNAVSTCPYGDENCDFSLLSRTWTLVNSCFPIGLNIPW